jgi:hypothetical protein
VPQPRQRRLPPPPQPAAILLSPGRGTAGSPASSAFSSSTRCNSPFSDKAPRPCYRRRRALKGTGASTSTQLRHHHPSNSIGPATPPPRLKFCRPRHPMPALPVSWPQYCPLNSDGTAATPARLKFHRPSQ